MSFFQERRPALIWGLVFVALGLILVQMLLHAPRFAMFIVSLFTLIWLLSRIVRFFPRRSIENWSGHGVATDLTPGEAGILIRARPGLIAAASLLWLEQGGKVRLHDEVPPRVEWVGSAPENDVERAAVRLENEADYLDFLEALYRYTNERMERYSGSTTTRHYRDFVERLWGPDVEETVAQTGIGAWFALRLEGREWIRLGDGPDAGRVKRGVRIASRLDERLFTQDLRRKVFSRPRTGFFRYRDDLEVDMREYKDFNPVDPFGLLDGARDPNSDSDSEDGNPDT